MLNPAASNELFGKNEFELFILTRKLCIYVQWINDENLDIFYEEKDSFVQVSHQLRKVFHIFVVDETCTK